MNRTATWLLAATTLAVPFLGLFVARAVAARRLRADVQQLFAAASKSPNTIYHKAQIIGLPAPVQRYFSHVLHDGQFNADIQNDWIAIEGEQYVTADPAGFIWLGATRWFKVRDYVAGHGSLTVRLLGAVPIVQGAGSHYDEGELLRWLAEGAWLPTTLLPSARSLGGHRRPFSPPHLCPPGPLNNAFGTFQPAR